MQKDQNAEIDYPARWQAMVMIGSSGFVREVSKRDPRPWTQPFRPVVAGMVAADEKPELI